MHRKQICCLLIFFSFFTNFILAQDTTRREHFHRDTLHHEEIRPDTMRRRYFDSSLFADNNVLTPSDYLLHIEKVYQILNKVPVIAGSFEKLPDIANSLDESDTALNVIKERISSNDRTLNLRNLQMFYTLLQAIQENDKKNAQQLGNYDNELDSLKREILDLRKDTALHHLFRDSVLRKSFTSQIQGLRSKWIITDSLVKNATSTINSLQTHASANGITITELLYQTNTLLTKIGPRAFTKERNYIWEPVPQHKNFSGKGYVKKSIDNENKAVRYYFSNTRSKRIWLLLTGVILFFWIFNNYRTLKNKNKLPLPETFRFKYINPWPFAACLVCMLTLAPLFDLHAPAIYIETTQFLLMLVLTGLFWKHWPRKMFYYWCGTVLLFVVLSFSRIIALPYYFQRWWILCINIAAIILGLLFWHRLKKTSEGKVLFFATAIYIIFNFLAVLCNFFGRLTFTQIFGYTSVYTFAQIVSLRVFIKSLEEGFLLQIYTSRVRKNYPEYFDAVPVMKGVNRLVTVIAIFICVMAFTINLNIYNFVYDILESFLTTPQDIGSVSFTFGGILLFLCIIWVANFLQKYIAYFFGDIGDDAAFDNKGQRSRLMITRLILLIAGFLLAVAALGLPVDKITVILGALGVGIGLGLQGIVNNFVSGIILIFDRPLRIGDTVDIGGEKGRVKEISIRSSTLLTAEGAEVIIPNGDLLSHNIVNWTLSNNHIRIDFTVTVDNLPNQDEIEKAFADIVGKNPDSLAQRGPEILFTYLKGKSVQMQFLFWCKDVSKMDIVKNEVSRQVYELLRQKELNIV